MLTNCRGLYGRQIAEHAFALLLSLTRQIPTQLEFMKTKHWERVPCVELAGMTMGILGLGGIGRAIAVRAHAFEFNVIAADAEPMDKPDTVSELFGLDGLMEFLARNHTSLWYAAQVRPKPINSYHTRSSIRCQMRVTS